MTIKSSLDTTINFTKDILKELRRIQNTSGADLTEAQQSEFLALCYSAKRCFGAQEKMLKLPPEPSNRIIHKG